MLLVAAAGILLRLWIWWNSVGTNDVVIWSEHAKGVALNGLAHTYLNSQAFNHPPLTGLWAALAWTWSDGNMLNFARLLKLPGMLGEAVTLAALWRFAGPQPFAVYATALGAILVAAFHGNTDALCSAFVVLSCIAFDRGRFLGAGLLFGAALNAKLFPLPLLPLVLIAPRSRRAWMLVFAGLAIAAVPFLPMAILAPEGLRRNILDYVPNLDNWGIMAFANYSRDIPQIGVDGSQKARVAYAHAGRALILIAMVAFGVYARMRTRVPVTRQMAIALVLFLALAPGFGMQYVIYLVPLLCLFSLRRGLEWGLISGVFILTVYLVFLVSWSPIQSFFTGYIKGPAPLVGILAWVWLWRYLASEYKEITRPQRAA